ncbi:unnamed protein product [Gongylonema pulchrum]|uniref:Glyco_transf_64 domain-containing protein n=1 Tax=Gongylonema pulchrum TaxID=637853 RepID=A0A183DX91_9BILA|nr:unnamed protein product [Gongylonema pulchrum]
MTFYRSRLSSVQSILRLLSFQRKQQMREQISFVYERYFSSLQKIVLTTLKILERRIISNSFVTYDAWNPDPRKQRDLAPLFLPYHAHSEGFTAVILTYNKPDSLFSVIRLLSRVRSLRSIVIVWNHWSQPPPATEWPQLNRPTHIIQMDRNLLSNRFILFSEITTEALFQTWRENPDRLVGFLPRAAVFNESTKQYEYATEWANSMNIILTGASFYHKYYGMLYHELLPAAMLDYVEKIMNCEDIAMNFLISNATGKSPIKVTPRKKFVCPKCDSNGISPWDVPRLLQRSACINKFVAFFNNSPLVDSVSRHDPVLFKTPSEIDIFNPYNQVGPL